MNNLGAGPKRDSILQKYVNYRYGGKMKIDKFDTESVYSEIEKNDAFHPTYGELVKEMDMDNCSDDDMRLISSLRQWYDDFPVKPDESKS